jgi:hypothetical protein
MRIFDDIGGAFSMGTIGGGLVHGIIGFRNAAQVGQREKNLLADTFCALNLC